MNAIWGSIKNLIWGDGDEYIELSDKEIELEPAFQGMSDELSVHIFEYLPAEEIPGKCQVSKAWNRILSDHTVWKRFSLSKLFPDACFINREF